MTPEEYPFVIGTAGHIDHGKTTLVKCLTGVDCDRLAEEKRRGMTIELGFAPLTLPSGKIVSIVDVPGHEKFVRHMVAGASGIDAALLVVAADDGVMPQTREHLTILTLLGVTRGIVVLTKTDLSDEEMIDAAEDEIRDLTRSTFLENSRIVRVSSATGSGIEELKAEISRMTDEPSTKDRKSPFIMYIDRAFHMRGFGTVVTGTVVRGEVHEGDEIEIMPRGVTAKVRSLQMHGAQATHAAAGQRAAMNLAAISLEEVKRGDVAAAKGCYAPAKCLNVWLTVPRDGTPLKHGQRCQLHTGTAERSARLLLLGAEKIAPGESAPAQVVIDEPITCEADAGFILRRESPAGTAAGGKIVTATGERPKNRIKRQALAEFIRALANNPPLADKLHAYADYRGVVDMREASVTYSTNVRNIRDASEELASRGACCVIKSCDAVISNSYTQKLASKVTDSLAAHHKESPESPGLTLDACAVSSGLKDVRIAKAFIAHLAQSSAVAITDGFVHLPDFTPDTCAVQKLASAVSEYLLKRGFALPTIDDVRMALGLSLQDMSRAVEFLRSIGDAAVITGKLLFLTKVQQALVERLSCVEGNITIKSVREATGATRSCAIAMLEHLDDAGITRRSRDIRILRREN